MHLVNLMGAKANETYGRYIVLYKIVKTFNIKPWVEVYSYWASSVLVTPLILSSRQFRIEISE